MVWICAEEGQLIYGTKNVQYGATRKEEKRKTSEKVHGCSDGGRAEGLCNRRGC